MKVHNRLVRDRIPEIIARTGKIAYTRILDNDEYLTELTRKVVEEFAEFCAANTVDDKLEELADLQEVLLAIAGHLGSAEKLEKIRLRKCEDRGGFDDRIFLLSVGEFSE